MRKQSLDFLRTLVNTPSPSGFESRGQRVWLDYIKQFTDSIETDAYGNAVARINKGGSPRVMLAGHADEIALIVHYITDDGFIYVRKLGGIDTAIAKAQRVTVHTKNGPINGVTGNIAIHLTKTQTEKKSPEISDIFIDIGVSSRKEAEKLIQVGDPITLNDEFELLRNDIAVARAFDNRVGTFAVAEAARLLSSQKSKLKAEICFVSNIMEEVGLFGSRQIAYSLQPGVAIVTDVTHATDSPTISKMAAGDVKLGGGPTLTFGGGNHREVLTRLESVAEKKKIPIQREAASNTTGTDTDAIFWTRGGIPSALISLPNRYMHSPVEIINLNDLQHISELMAGFCLSLKKGEKFKIKV